VTIDDESTPMGTTRRHIPHELSSQNASLASASVLQFNTQAVTLKLLARRKPNFKMCNFFPIYEQLDFSSDFMESRISISKKFFFSCPAAAVCG
jgi:hypothetical protein